MSYPKKTIYLAGPISGLTYDAARNGWRAEFSMALDALDNDHIFCASPMRAKQFLSDVGKIDASYEMHPLATAAGITTRDYNDVRTADAMVACFLDSDAPSLGTAVEFGYAHAHRVPIIIVARDGDVHRCHPMLSRMAGYITDDMEEAAHIAYHLLAPGL